MTSMGLYSGLGFLVGKKAFLDERNKNGGVNMKKNEMILNSLKVNKRGVGGGFFIAALVELVLALALLPTVRTFVNNSKNGDSNDTLLDIIPTFWIIGAVVVAAVLSYAGVKNK